MRSHWWLILLKVCVSLTVLARGWLTWRWDSPIRGLFWQEGWWSGFIDWNQFATHSDAAITKGLEILGITLMVSAIVPWIDKARYLLLPMAGILLLDSFARFIGSGNHLGMAIEHSLQWGMPVFLFMALKKSGSSVLWMQIASALTFIGHGLYAAGFHPVPLKYQAMTSKLIGLEGDATLKFLLAAGILDFIAAVGIFLAPVRKVALLYMILWGGATALARVVSGASLDPWLMETAVRTSHWLVPLLLLFSEQKRGYQ